MSDFIVSARKYRPATFSSVVGQKHITSTLKNAIERGQLAHAYLFCGPRGVGKTTCARIFAKAINCLHPEGAEACNTCESCRSFNDGRSLNIHELDAASNNSVEDIRSLIEQVRIIPQVGRYSGFIIDEVHMLSTAAFNALLPRGHTIVVVEHNMDIIKCADWIVDLGPEAGTAGGRVVFEGTPRELEKCTESHTGKFLRMRAKIMKNEK